MKYWFVFLIFFISGCYSTYRVQQLTVPVKITKPKPVLLDSIFGDPQYIPSSQEILELTQEQKIHYLQKYNSEAYQLLEPNRRVYKYLENHLANFNFHSETLIAQEALSQNSGNCMSLAILTKSLADLSNVDIGYQLVETASVYQKEGGLLLSSQHLRTILYDPEKDKETGVFVFIRGRIVVDYFPSKGTRTLRQVKEGEFYSMYYRNKGAEAMIKKDKNQAYWYLKESLKFEQYDSQAINMMAILHDRLGYTDYAENLYIFGLTYGRDKLELLSNYHNLLKRAGRIEDAAGIAIELKKYDERNPFDWIKLANASYNTKNYSAAVSYYKKAAKMADYLHQPFAGIARAQYLLGNYSKAKKFMKLALERSHKEQTKSLYQTKYEFFMNQIESH